MIRNLYEIQIECFSNLIVWVWCLNKLLISPFVRQWITGLDSVEVPLKLMSKLIVHLELFQLGSRLPDIIISIFDFFFSKPFFGDLKKFANQLLFTYWTKNIGLHVCKKLVLPTSFGLWAFSRRVYHNKRFTDLWKAIWRQIDLKLQ